MPFGEYELSPSLIGLSLLHTPHREAFQRRVTGTSAWTCVDHSVSRLPPLTHSARFRLAFAAARDLMALNLARDGNS